MGIHDIIDTLAEADRQLRETRFLAPRVGAGAIQTHVDGLVREFDVEPEDFEGWGIFEARNVSTAELQCEARLPEIEEYLELFEPLRAFLIEEIDDESWMAMPVNRSDMRQRFGEASPFVVHLVRDGRPFEPVVTRSDGRAHWFERPDRRIDPRCIDALRREWQDRTWPGELDIEHMTPEMRMTYEMRWAGRDWGPSRNERRLEDALETADGELCDVESRDDHWRVEWRTSEGERHVSLIERDDLTVVSAGICLSGRDRDFDLESLVGVVEERPEWMGPSGRG